MEIDGPVNFDSIIPPSNFTQSGSSNVSVGISTPGFDLLKTVVHSITSNPEDECYVLATSTNFNNTIIAAASSTYLIKLYDNNTLDYLGQLQGHTNTINDISFAHSHPDVLFSASSDSTIRVWDVREKVPGPVYHGQSEFFSLGIEPGDTLFASGDKGDVKVWDVRTTKQLRQYPDFHQEDITQVRFHPLEKSNLFTASVDGTICKFDINQEDEDEAFISGMNPDEAVSKIDFFGPNAEYLYCLTTAEKFSLWNIEGDRLVDFGDARASLSTEQFQIQYFIDCKYDSSSDMLFLLAGNHNGQIGIIHVQDNQLRPFGLLPHGHTSTVRSFEWNTRENRMVTAGEDSRICMWGANKSFKDEVKQRSEPLKVLAFCSPLVTFLLQMSSPKRFQAAHETKPY